MVGNKKKDYIVLGIYEVHLASACLMINGEVIVATHEERFSKIKNDVGMPIKSIQFCLDFAGIDPKDIDCVAISNLDFNKNGISNILFKRPAVYSIDDWQYENDKYWHKTLIEGKKIDSYFDIMGGWERANKYHHYYNLKKINFRKSNEELSKIFNDLRKDCLNKYFGIDKKKIIFTPHYLCHHYHAYYSARSNFNNNQIIMHIEGDGGKYNCGVSKATTNGIKFLGGSNQGDIGRLYQWTTLNLGMKPYHHEYKVMGLAPYATDIKYKNFKIFKNLFKVSNDSNAIVYNPRFKPKDLYFTINRLIQGHRFDGVAGALQTNETIILDWFKSNIHINTNLKKFSMGRGSNECKS